MAKTMTRHSVEDGNSLGAWHLLQPCLRSCVMVIDTALFNRFAVQVLGRSREAVSGSSNLPRDLSADDYVHPGGAVQRSGYSRQVSNYEADLYHPLLRSLEAVSFPTKERSGWLTDGCRGRGSGSYRGPSSPMPHAFISSRLCTSPSGFQFCLLNRYRHLPTFPLRSS
jgi:hypothetical protein